jgi:hypothetical protein
VVRFEKNTQESKRLEGRLGDDYRVSGMNNGPEGRAAGTLAAIVMMRAMRVPFGFLCVLGIAVVVRAVRWAVVVVRIYRLI